MSVRALHRVPSSSTSSYILLPPKVVQCRAIVSWPAATARSEAVEAWLLEVSVRPCDGDGVAWFDWEPVANIPADETSHILPVEPGLEYRFRVAALSETEGQLPFSEATAPVSALGDPLKLGGEGARTPRAPVAPPPAAPPRPPPDDDAMPWDSPGLATALPPPPPPPPDDLRCDTWVSGEQPLLAMVPTTAELALLQAQSSLAAAVRAGKRRLRVELHPPGLNGALDSSHP